MTLSQTFLKATLDQDHAAGGSHRRKLKIKSGDIVSVSLVTSGTKSPYRVVMRFKSAITVQREVGRFDAASPAEAVRQAWKVIRPEQVVEREGWSWVSQDSEVK
jgi:translation initiation factor IF-1